MTTTTSLSTHTERQRRQGLALAYSLLLALINKPTAEEDSPSPVDDVPLAAQEQPGEERT